MPVKIDLFRHKKLQNMESNRIIHEVTEHSVGKSQIPLGSYMKHVISSKINILKFSLCKGLYVFTQ